MKINKIIINGVEANKEDIKTLNINVAMGKDRIRRIEFDTDNNLQISTML